MATPPRPPFGADPGRKPGHTHPPARRGSPLRGKEAPAGSGGREGLLEAFIDGASRNNPGHSALGVVIKDAAGAVLAEESSYLGIGTNNEAEYRALLRALERSLALGASRLRVHSDSELVVRQIEGRYRVKEPRLRELHSRAVALLARFDEAGVVHVPRERNREADRLANRALDDHIREVRGKEEKVPKQAG